MVVSLESKIGVKVSNNVQDSIILRCRAYGYADTLIQKRMAAMQFFNQYAVLLQCFKQLVRIRHANGNKVGFARKNLQTV